MGSFGGKSRTEFLELAQSLPGKAELYRVNPDRKKSLNCRVVQSHQLPSGCAGRNFSERRREAENDQAHVRSRWALAS